MRSRRSTAASDYLFLVPTQTPSALAIKSMTLADGLGPSPTTRKPGSTALAASVTQLGSAPYRLPSTTPRIEPDLSGSRPARTTLRPGASLTSAAGLTATSATPGFSSAISRQGDAAEPTRAR